MPPTGRELTPQVQNQTCDREEAKEPCKYNEKHSSAHTAPPGACQRSYHTPCIHATEAIVHPPPASGNT
jgi:hypothetical protein